MKKETCRILAKDCYMNNQTWKTGLNNNDVIIGPSGSGKTRGYVVPNILQGNESMIIADTKGGLKRQVGEVLQKNGYKIISIDFVDCLQSWGYNPFDFIRYDQNREKYNEQDIKTLSACIAPVEERKDPFWDLAARMYLESMVAYVLECLPEEEHNLTSVMRLFSEMGTGRFERLFEELNQLNPESFAAIQYNMYKKTARAERMYESIRGVLAEKLSIMSFDGTKKMFHKTDKIHFADLGKEKTAVFITVSDTDRAMDKLVNLFYTQALHTLCCSADKNPKGNRLTIPVRLILDDFATNVEIPDFDKIISVIRSREIYVSIILQSISQLEALYGHAKAMTILNNCDNLLYLGGQDVETARYISIKANKTIQTILNMPLKNSWLFTRGETPKEVEKYDLKYHQRYKELSEYQNNHM